MSSPTGKRSESFMSDNPLAGGGGKTSSSSVKKFEQLSGTILIPEAAWSSLLTRMKAFNTNEERLSFLETEKLPYLFSSMQLMTMVETITPSVKTRLAMIHQIGPRLIDPKAKASQFIALFRYVEEKEKVEAILKARTQVVMARSLTMFRPPGVMPVAPAAMPPTPKIDTTIPSHHTPSSPNTFNGLISATSSPPVVTVPIQTSSQYYDEKFEQDTNAALNASLAHMSIWREVNGKDGNGSKEHLQPTVASTKSTSLTATMVSNSSTPSSSVMVSSVQSRLQPGWIAVTDTSTMEVYYFNETTGESQWDPPLVMESNDALKQLPEGWTIMQDRTTHNNYYYNRNTGESTWELPVAKPDTKASSNAANGNNTSTKAGSSGQSSAKANTGNVAVTPTKKQDASSLPAGWTEGKDANNDIYYFHRATGVSQWERPTEPLPSLATPLLAPLQSLPEGWSAQSDPATGRTYYYHRITQTTQWELPR